MVICSSVPSWSSRINTMVCIVDVHPIDAWCLWVMDEPLTYLIVRFVFVVVVVYVDFEFNCYDTCSSHCMSLAGTIVPPLLLCIFTAHERSYSLRTRCFHHLFFFAFFFFFFFFDAVSSPLSVMMMVSVWFIDLI